MSRHYYRTAFQLLTDKSGRSYWGVPHARAVLDLRSIPEQSQRGGTPGLCICVSDQPPSVVGSDYDLLGVGNWHDVKVNQRLLDSLPKPSKTYRPAGDDLVGVIRDLLIGAADPTGDTFAKPLIPTVGGRMELHLGQFHAERFKWGDRGTDKIRDVIRSDFKSAFDDAQAGRSRAGHHQRVLDYWCEKYGVEEWREFVAPGLQKDISGRLKHETTITESFNQMDSTTLGPDLTWTEVNNNWDTFVNRLRYVTSGGATNGYARAESDLSSSDHYGQIDVVDIGALSLTTGGGPVSRFAAAASTFYYSFAFQLDDRLYVGKHVAGIDTAIANAAITLSIPEAYKNESNGSTIKGYQAGVERVSATDTSISGNTRTGVVAYHSLYPPIFDNFSASDLAASGTLYTQLERSTRGILRGVYTHY